MSEERSGRVHTFLRLEDVHFAFAGTNCTLQGINLALAAGEVHCILGRSGCGKTTLLKLAAGLLTPKTGTVSVGGRPPAAAREDIGFVFQQPNLWRCRLSPLPATGSGPCSYWHHSGWRICTGATRASFLAASKVVWR